MIIDRRIIAGIRADFPITHFIPGVMAGQLLAFYAPFLGTAAIFVAAPFLLLFKSKISALAGSVLIGFLSSAVMQPALNDNLELPTNVLVQLAQDPKPRKMNEVTLSLDILSASGSGLNEPHLTGQKILCQAIYLPWKNIYPFEAGDIFFVRATFTNFPKSLNPFSYASSMRRAGYQVECRIQYASPRVHQTNPFFPHLRRYLGEQVREVLGDGQRAGLFLSMTLGGRGQISLTTENAFKRVGLSHLLVVSGYQVTLIYSTWFFVIFWIWTRSSLCCAFSPAQHVAHLLGLLGATLFLFVAGSEMSLIRASLAALLACFSALSERGGGFFNSVLCSFLVLALLFPGAYFEPGVELTFAALLGICLGTFKGKGSKVRAYLLSFLYASLFTGAVTIAWFDQFSLVGLILNPVFATPISFIACNGGFLALLIKSIGLDPHGYLLQAISWGLLQFKDSVFWFSKFKYASIELVGVSKYLALSIYLIWAGWLVRDLVLPRR